MFRHLLIPIFVLSLFSCCAYAQPAQRHKIAWDGLGRDPNLPPVTSHAKNISAGHPDDPNAKRQNMIAALRPYSQAWWVVHDEIEAENDRRISSRLVICQGCIPHVTPQDVTGSIP